MNEPLSQPLVALKELRAWANMLGEDVEKVSAYLLDNPNLPLWSGSSLSSQHHYGKGGLIIHIWEVVRIINETLQVALPQYLNKIDEKEWFMAALFHDAGKLYDYKPTDDTYEKWDSTDHKRYIHHISRSAIMWTEAAMRSNFIRTNYHDKVLHAILAHHGFREAGSPISPKSRVAWLVHLCDGISARMYDAGTWDIIKK